MNPKQEPKYEARNGRIYNRASGEPIPDDEPVFIFRARDSFAIAALDFYANLISKSRSGNALVTLQHISAVLTRVKDFEAFARDHHERMKVPDTAESAPPAAEAPLKLQATFTHVELEALRSHPDVLRALADQHLCWDTETSAIGPECENPAYQKRANELRALADSIEAEY